MNIGIYTIHACNNFGALLQAYATARFLKDNGYDAEIVNLMTIRDEKMMHYRYPCTNIKNIIFNIYAFLNPQIYKKIVNFNKFRKLLPLSKRYYSKKEIKNTPPKYDLHIAGSDQIWNMENENKEPFYFLSFLPSSYHRISFASSFGNVEAAKKNKDIIKKALSFFDYRSVREQDAAEFLTKECQLQTSCVLDPTFLLSSKQWDEIAGKEPIIKGKYILYYGFDKNEFCKNSIQIIRDRLKLPIIGISVSLHSPYNFDKFYQEAGPAEFLNLIKNATFIITSSFHGLALSINYRKDFVVLKHGTRMSRMESLLNQMKLKDRIINNTNQLNEIINTHPYIDYNILNTEINNIIKESQRWLNMIIKCYE